MCTRPLHRSWRAAARRDTTWEGSSVALVPAPRSPLLLGRRRRAQGWQQIRTMVLPCSWSPWLCPGSLHPHSCAHCNPGRAGITLLCLSGTATQCPRSHVGCRPCLAGHIQKSNSLAPLMHVSHRPAGICSLAAPHPPWQFGNLAFHRDGGPQRAHGALHLAGLSLAAPFLAQSPVHLP